MSRVDAFVVVVTSVGSQVGAAATAATVTDKHGEVNVSGVVLGGAQRVHGVVDLSSKRWRATSAATWGRAVPSVEGLGFSMGAGLGHWAGRRWGLGHDGLAASPGHCLGALRVMGTWGRNTISLPLLERL